jgi:hypothetical protein
MLKVPKNELLWKIFALPKNEVTDTACCLFLAGHLLSLFFNPADFFWSKPHFICNLYMYIQQIGVRIGCYGFGRDTHYCPSVVIGVMSLVGHGRMIRISKLKY